MIVARALSPYGEDLSSWTSALERHVEFIIENILDIDRVLLYHQKSIDLQAKFCGQGEETIGGIHKSFALPAKWFYHVLCSLLSVLESGHEKYKLVKQSIARTLIVKQQM